MVRKLFQKGDVIMTTPAPGHYGIAIVLDDAIPIERSPGCFSYPMNHIMITPIIMTRPITMEDINTEDLKPVVFKTYFLKNGVSYYLRDEVCIEIYTNRNKAGFDIIGTVETTELYKEPLLWDPMGDRFFLYGDVADHLGSQVYVQYCEKNNLPNVYEQNVRIHNERCKESQAPRKTESSRKTESTLKNSEYKIHGNEK